LEWFVTRDGNLRFKTYNRNLQTLGGSINSSQTYTAGGASLLYTKSFNYIFTPQQKEVPAVVHVSKDLTEK
jgi:hypothetical protein